MAIQYGYYSANGTSHILIRTSDGSRWDKLGEMQKEEDARITVEALNGTLTMDVADSLEGLA